MLIHSFNCYAFSACDEPTTTLSDRKNEQQNKNIPYSQRLPWKEGGRKDNQITQKYGTDNCYEMRRSW